jgi:hypothetical protein
MTSARPSQFDPGSLLGTWKLRSFTTEYLDTGEKVEPFGAQPKGYLSYAADGRMCVIIVKELRQPPLDTVPTDAEKIELFDSSASYAGRYTVEDDKISHHVDISWIESWTGTTQVRAFKLEGGTLSLRSVPAKDFQQGRSVSATAVWTRV